MKIIRTKNFSKHKSKKRSERDNRMLAGEIATAGGLIGGGIIQTTAANGANAALASIIDKHDKRTPRPEEEEEVKKLVKNLEEKANKNGTRVVYSPEGSFHDPKGRRINIASTKNNTSKAATLAHEYGHATYADYAKNKSKDIVGRAGHKAYKISRLVSDPSYDIKANTKYGKIGVKHAGFFANGFDSGYRTVRKKAAGEKDSFINKAKPVLLGAAVSAPMLIAEGAATRTGLKELKSAGASKRILRDARRELNECWGTYGSMSAIPILTGEAGRIAGKGKAYRDFYDESGNPLPEKAKKKKKKKKK